MEVTLSGDQSSEIPKIWFGIDTSNLLDSVCEYEITTSEQKVDIHYEASGNADCVLNVVSTKIIEHNNQEIILIISM